MKKIILFLSIMILTCTICCSCNFNSNAKSIPNNTSVLDSNISSLIDVKYIEYDFNNYTLASRFDIFNDQYILTFSSIYDQETLDIVHLVNSDINMIYNDLMNIKKLYEFIDENVSYEKYVNYKDSNLYNLFSGNLITGSEFNKFYIMCENVGYYDGVVEFEKHWNGKNDSKTISALWYAGFDNDYMKKNGVNYNDILPEKSCIKEIEMIKADFNTCIKNNIKYCRYIMISDEYGYSGIVISKSEIDYIISNIKNIINN